MEAPKHEVGMDLQCAPIGVKSPSSADVMFPPSDGRINIKPEVAMHTI